MWVAKSYSDVWRFSVWDLYIEAQFEDIAPPTLILTSSLRGGAPKAPNPLYGWCKTMHKPLKAAQSGYEGYCKSCYQQKFPEKHRSKQDSRMLICGYCGEKRELVHGSCKPCSRARACASCGARAQDAAADALDSPTEKCV